MFQNEILATISKDEFTQKFYAECHSDACPMVISAVESFKELLSAHVFQKDEPHMLVLVANMDLAAAWQQNLRGYLPNDQVLIFPSQNTLPFENLSQNTEIVAERLEVLKALAGDFPALIIAPVEALLARLQKKEEFKSSKITLHKNTEIEIDDLAKRLVELGYKREMLVDLPGTFACRGGIADIFPISADRPLRLDFFDTEIESMKYFNPKSQRSEEEFVGTLELFSPTDFANQNGYTLLEYLKENSYVVLDEPAKLEEILVDAQAERKAYLDDLLSGYKIKKDMLLDYEKTFVESDEIIAQINGSRLFSFSNLEQRSIFKHINVHQPQATIIPGYTGKMQIFNNDLALWRSQNCQTFFCASTPMRAQSLRELLADYNLPQVAVGVMELGSGFHYGAGKIAVVTEKELLDRDVKNKGRKRKKDVDMSTFVDMKVGDLVVHTNHGIGKFLGIERMTAAGLTQDYIAISYANNDKLYIPLEQMDMVQKYIGNEGVAPKISRLGGNQWAKLKAKAKASVKDLADELLRLYAAREKAKGFAFAPDTTWQREFEDAFEFVETDGQLKAITDIKNDMENIKPMERLLCGDVGYGKTEVAMRAAFKACMDSKQVAMLVPTTLLAEQHFKNFTKRMANYPVKVAVISRFVPLKKQKEILAEVESGAIDILIGTHRLLSKDIKFKDLGLLIIDEEQRFGVAHKEKIKKWRGEVDILTLSATPIPRTLHMSLVGMRDMSVITTPPEDRIPVQTFVVENHPRLIKNALEREISRQGQVYYIYNNVAGIERKRNELQALVPSANILIAHGQMTERQLEPVMTNFMAGNGDILLCTTIAESGLDVANVNTLIVEEADHFGLAQLYQLRGRVGRSSRQAFAYFTFEPNKSINDQARKRLSAIREFTELGSGFKIAMRDLEIRGAGNILGPQQHGHIAAIGFDLYCRLVAEEVEAGLSGDTTPKVERKPTKIDLGLNAYIPDDYITDTAMKFEIYNKIAAAQSDADIEDLRRELTERFGNPPKMVENLFTLMEVRNPAQILGAASVLMVTVNLVINFGNHNPFSGTQMIKIAQKHSKTVKFSQQNGFTMRYVLGNLSDIEKIQKIKCFLQELVAISQEQ